MVGDLIPEREVILSKLGEIAGMIGGFLVSGLASATRGTVNFILQLCIMLYANYFFLRSGKDTLAKIMYMVPLESEQEDRLVARFVSVTRATLKGSLVIGIIQGTLAGLAFAMAGIEGAIFWGTIMAVLSIIPAVGAAIVWIPAVIYLFATGHVAAGVGLLVWCGVVVGSSDNILRPILVGKDTKMPDLLVLLSTLGGIAVYGALGVILGPIIAALFLTVWELYGEAFKDVLPEVKQVRAIFLAVIGTAVLGPSLVAQQSGAEVARDFRDANGPRILREYAQLLSMPNVASDSVGIWRNAEYIRDELAERGVNARLLTLPGANPIVYGELMVPGATRTLGLYVHYDGQPVDPANWTHDPWEPVLYTRSMEAGGEPRNSPAEGKRLIRSGASTPGPSGDDKAPIGAMLPVLEAFQAEGVAPTSNLIFFFEGEEEAGSTNLGRVPGRLRRPHRRHRRLAPLRRPGPPERPSPPQLRCTRCHRDGGHRLWTHPGAPPRPLRELGSGPRPDAGEPPGLHEGRRGECPDRWLLRHGGASRGHRDRRPFGSCPIRRRAKAGAGTGPDRGRRTDPSRNASNFLP